MDLDSFEKRKYDMVELVIEFVKIVKDEGLWESEKIISNRKLEGVEFIYLKKALKLMSEGSTQEHIEFIMELEKMKYIKDHRVNENDLQLITIMQKLIPFIHQCDLIGIDNICSYIFSSDKYNKLILEIKKIDAKYDLTKEDILLNAYHFAEIKYFYPNCSEQHINEIKKNGALEEFNFTYNYYYDGFIFKYLAESPDEKILIETINPGDDINITELIDKINNIKEKIQLKTDKISLVVGVNYTKYKTKKNELRIIDNINSIEELFEIIKNCKNDKIEEIDRGTVMIIDENETFFQNMSIGIIGKRIQP